MHSALDLAVLHRWSRVGTALAVAAVLATAGLLGFGAQRADAQPTASDWYTVQSRLSGLTLDIQGVSTEPGAILTQYTNWANPNQQFRFIDVGNGYHKIQVRHSGLVLDVWNHSAADGGTIAQYADTGDTKQQWKVTENAEGLYSVVSRFSGKALDVRDWSTTVGSPIVQHTVSGYANQQWQLTPVGSTCGADIRQGSNAGCPWGGRCLRAIPHSPPHPDPMLRGLSFFRLHLFKEIRAAQNRPEPGRRRGRGSHHRPRVARVGADRAAPDVPARRPRVHLEPRRTHPGHADLLPRGLWHSRRLAHHRRADRGREFPVVEWSHGLDGSPESYGARSNPWPLPGSSSRHRVIGAIAGDVDADHHDS